MPGEYGGPLFLRVDLSPGSLPPTPHCAWPESEETRRRHAFCDNYEGYPGLCRCLQPHPILPEATALVGRLCRTVWYCRNSPPWKEGTDVLITTLHGCPHYNAALVVHCAHSRTLCTFPTGIPVATNFTAMGLHGNSQRFREYWELPSFYDA